MAAPLARFYRDERVWWRVPYQRSARAFSAVRDNGVVGLERASEIVAPAEWQRRRPWWPEMMLEVARHYLSDHLALSVSEAAEVRIGEPYYESGDTQSRFPRIDLEVGNQTAMLRIGRAIRGSTAEIALETWEPVVNGETTAWFTTATLYPIPQSYRVRVADALIRSYLDATYGPRFSSRKRWRSTALASPVIARRFNA